MLELSFGFGIFSGILLGYHCWLLLTQQTSVEHAANTWRAGVLNTEFGREWARRNQRTELLTLSSASPYCYGARNVTGGFDGATRSAIQMAVLLLGSEGWPRNLAAVFGSANPLKAGLLVPSRREPVWPPFPCPRLRRLQQLQQHEREKVEEHRHSWATKTD